MRPAPDEDVPCATSALTSAFENPREDTGRECRKCHTPANSPVGRPEAVAVGVHPNPVPSYLSKQVEYDQFGKRRPTRAMENWLATVSIAWRFTRPQTEAGHALRNVNSAAADLK